MHTHVAELIRGFAISKNGVPIYVQLRDYLSRSIRDGKLAPGDQMPTMRQVAVAHRVDINTVRHAYDDLERAGLITLARGRGSFVAGPGDPNTPNLESLDALARQTLRSAVDAGIDPISLAGRIVALAKLEDAES